MNPREEGHSGWDVGEPSASLDALCHRVIGAAIEVHRSLGPGFIEVVYERATCVELRLRGIPHEQQVPVGVMYKGHPIGTGRIDLLVDSRLVVEIKVVETIAPIHVAQVISYLKATGLPLGLLITFNVQRLSLGVKRVVLTS